ncbi:magnesium transporter [Melghiribacillus thermohalophilus]|uniref:Magnesium transporter MgtE n=1 Tax=Melghiribacillus thermohalophilus TaxID=1324956 RepID=A0A4R3N076_9BACI|nr:magnesium transporter [Melghiribacillus thermohalophilus]TCT22398.1 magnesium transporter [Melghiribacillus thermohalophilus]
MEHLTEDKYGELMNTLNKALEKDDIERFRYEFLQLHSYDQAHIFNSQTDNARQKIYTYLSPEEMAEILQHFDSDQIEPVIAEMDPRFAVQILEEMSTDDAVDILNTLDKNIVASFLAIMNKEEASEIKDLLHYEEKTAGSIMTTEFVSVSSYMNVREAMLHLRNVAPDAETIYYVYVVDDQKRLVGVISLRDLIIAEDDCPVKEIMSERIVSVSVGDDQEEVGRVMMDYDLLALPVVDFQNHLLGIITVDDIMDVMEEEASEDYSKFAAVADMEKLDKNSFHAARKRIPWLVILLFLGMVTATIISRFETILSEKAILVVFIPLIMGMAGNTGTQALAVAVRGIATGELEKEGKKKIVYREAGTGLITGFTCGILIMAIVYLWKGDIYLGILVGITIMATLFVATIAGAFVPLVMHVLKIDPAVASGPFITTINDIISILIYFGIATVFMNLLL